MLREQSPQMLRHGTPRRGTPVIMHHRMVILAIAVILQALMCVAIIINPRRVTTSHSITIQKAKTMLVKINAVITLLIGALHFDLAVRDRIASHREVKNDTIRPLAIRAIKDKNNDSQPFKAGRLAQYVSRWKKMRAPGFILQIISGYRIPFRQKPPLITPHLKSDRRRTLESDEMTMIIRQMKQQGVLQVVALSPSFLSPLFLIPKSDGTHRPIFNLRMLNLFVLTERFRLINMYRVPDFLQMQDWMCKVDLSQAYFNLPIAQSHRRFLRLLYKDELLEMTCLPFGLSTAPKVFACLTNWIAQTLREKGIRIIVYLDDFLIAHQNPYVVTQHVKLLLESLEFLGFQINYGKSVLVPQKQITYLGIVWHTWENYKKLPAEKSTAVIKKSSHVLETGDISLKELQSLVGLLNFASFVIPRGRLNHRATLNFLNTLPENATSTRFVLPPTVLEEMHWWIQNSHLSTLIHIPPPTHFLTTDASDTAWGAQLDNQAISGVWHPEEQNLHCNLKELLAILKVLETHAVGMSGGSVLIQSDNRSAVAYLRNEGGTKSQSLMKVTQRILLVLDYHQIHFKIYHIPGKFNNHADCLSRHRRTPEWHLIPTCTDMIFAKMGTPVIDLFASKTARVLANYVTLDLNDHNAIFHDAFSLTWNFPLAWIFPPPFLIPRVLMHLNKAIGVYLLVVPRWEKVFWRADLKSRAIAPPFTLTNLKRFLIDTTTGLPPPKVQDMILEIWKCGGGMIK